MPFNANQTHPLFDGWIQKGEALLLVADHPPAFVVHVSLFELLKKAASALCCVRVLLSLK